MEWAIRYLLERHRELDQAQGDSSVVARERKQLQTLTEKVHKIKRWLGDNDDKPGKSGRPRQEQFDRQRQRQNEERPRQRPPQNWLSC
jgi:sialic acid synthase SpsE